MILLTPTNERFLPQNSYPKHVNDTDQVIKAGVTNLRQNGYYVSKIPPAPNSGLLLLSAFLPEQFLASQHVDGAVLLLLMLFHGGDDSVRTC